MCCNFYLLLYLQPERHKKLLLLRQEKRRGNGFYFQTVTLQMLYKLKTSKVFEKPKAGEGRAAELVEEDPFAVQMVSWCPQSRIFCVVGISAHIILYRFSKYEANNQIVVSEKEIARTKTPVGAILSSQIAAKRWFWFCFGVFFVRNHFWSVFSQHPAPTLAGRFLANQLAILEYFII